MSGKHSKSTFELIFDYLSYHEYSSFYKLLEQAEPKLRDIYFQSKEKTTGLTLLQRAVDRNCSLEIIEYLLLQKSDPTLILKNEDNIFSLWEKYAGFIDPKSFSALFSSLKEFEFNWAEHSVSKIASLLVLNLLKEREDKKPLENHLTAIDDFFSSISQSIEPQGRVYLIYEALSACLMYRHAGSQSLQLATHFLDKNSITSHYTYRLLNQCVIRQEPEWFVFILENTQTLSNTHITELKSELEKNPNNSHYKEIFDNYLTKMLLVEKIKIEKPLSTENQDLNGKIKFKI